MNTILQNPVLIVGAGPTGMVLAIELARRRIPCRVVDAKDGPDQTSRSFTLHAKTMEMLEHMGIAHVFLDGGIKSRGFYFNFKGKDSHPTIDFTGLSTRYPYVLIYNQNETEAKLREHLESTYDIRPEWSTRLSALNAENGGFGVTLAHSDREETIRTDWVVGCDGIHSFVRKAMDLEFKGENYEGMLMQMMDVRYHDFDGPDDWIHYYMAKNNFLLITKLPGENHRVLISNMGEAGGTEMTLRDTFQGLIDGHFEGSRLDEPKWVTQWTIWKRLATDYRAGNAFLAGDAAHVHSPSGGQGMNVGMQDAFNLGWKLAMVIKGEAKPELLDTYGLERRPVGEQAIAGTDAMHDIIMAHGQGMKDRLELTQTDGWRQKTVNRISGLSYTYRDVVDVPDDLSPPDGLTPGDRAPDVQLTRRLRVFDLFRHPRLTALLIPTAGDTSDRHCCQHLLTELQARFPKTVKAFVISDREIPDLEKGHCIEAESGAFEEVYGSSEVSHLYLVRPDGYVAFHGGLGERDLAFAHLERWFN